MFYPLVFGISAKKNALIVYHVLQETRVQRIPEKRIDFKPIYRFELAKDEKFTLLSVTPEAVYVATTKRFCVAKPLSYDKMILKSIFDPLHVKRIEFAETLLQYEWNRKVKNEERVSSLII